MFDPLSERLRRCRDMQSLANCLLHQVLEQSHARFGNVQLMDWKRGYLSIKAQSGFGHEFLNFFEKVYVADGSACARALRSRSPIVVEDITTDRQFEPCLEIMRRANVRAVQSTPMLSSKGALVGVLSIHLPQAYRPTEIELRNLEYAAQIAADAFLPLLSNGGSPRDAITSSMELLGEAHQTIEHVKKLLARDPLSRDGRKQFNSVFG